MVPADIIVDIAIRVCYDYSIHTKHGWRKKVGFHVSSLRLVQKILQTQV